MVSKIRMRTGRIEIDFEGSEEFLKKELPKLISSVSRLPKDMPAIETTAKKTAKRKAAARKRVVKKKEVPSKVRAKKAAKKAGRPKVRKAAKARVKTRKAVQIPSKAKAGKAAKTRFRAKKTSKPAPKKASKRRAKPAPKTAPKETAASLAAKLGCASGSDLIVAAAAFLAFNKKKDKFNRRQLLNEMKVAEPFYKKNYSRNLSAYIKSLLKSEKLVSPSKNSFGLNPSFRAELEAKLAAG